MHTCTCVLAVVDKKKRSYISVCETVWGKCHVPWLHLESHSDRYKAMAHKQRSKLGASPSLMCVCV